MSEYAHRAARNLAALRESKPRIHNITIFVVMNYTANALLAMGASPVMAHAPDEVEEMVGLAGALVLNIGTLTGEWVDSMLKAGKAAGARKDKNDFPITTDFDLYSLGPDGQTHQNLQNAKSRDDIVRAGEGAFVGKASTYDP